VEHGSELWYSPTSPDLGKVTSLPATFTQPGGSRSSFHLLAPRNFSTAFCITRDDTRIAGPSSLQYALSSVPYPSAAHRDLTDRVKMYRGGGSNTRYGSRGNFSARGRGNGRQTTRQRGSFADGVWYCDCTPRLPAERFKVKKDGPNHGRWFYTCQVGKDNGCGFFLWDDDAKPREEAAVLSGKRTEPTTERAQDNWGAGEAQNGVQGKGLFSGHALEPSRWQRDASTASPSPPSSRQTVMSDQHGYKRTAEDAEFGDDFGLDDIGHQPETPYKAQKTGVYATPATTGKRKLPWLMEEATANTSTSKPAEDYFNTPSKRTTQTPTIKQEPGTPAAQATLATAASPSPPARYRDALHNPADSGSSLTSEVLAALSTTNISSDVRETLRSICTKHDLRYQGVVKGRDVSRLAIKAKDAKITEIQARIASIEADREVEKSLSRMRRWQSESKAE
jgi:hypothetical protein